MPPLGIEPNPNRVRAGYAAVTPEGHIPAFHDALTPPAQRQEDAGISVGRERIEHSLPLRRLFYRQVTGPPESDPRIAVIALEVTSWSYAHGRYLGPSQATPTDKEEVHG